jgi:hypothetical protein
MASSSFAQRPSNCFAKPLRNHSPQEPESTKEEPQGDKGIAGLRPREKLIEKCQEHIGQKQSDSDLGKETQ